MNLFLSGEHLNAPCFGNQGCQSKGLGACSTCWRVDGLFRCHDAPLDGGDSVSQRQSDTLRL